SSCPLSK
nr:Chain C, Epstein Barr Virus, Latent membrane protein-2 epitope [synthetic construct]